MRTLFLVMVAANAFGCHGGGHRGIEPSPVAAAGPSISPRWEAQQSGTTESLRGLCAVDRQVAWASGAAGTVLRTTDGGERWTLVSVPAAEALDFRDVHAFDAQQAIVLAAGDVGRMYRTSDGGRSWNMTYDNRTTGVFFDALDFRDAQHGMAFSDPIDGHLLIVTTRDGGRSWRGVAPERIPRALDHEAGFAASGTCLATHGDAAVWIGLGGASARVFRSVDRGQTWEVSETPLAAGAASKGVFSIAIRDALHGVAVGGDYLAPDDASANIARTMDGGRTWVRTGGDPPGGFRSCVAYVPDRDVPTLVAVGTNGSDVSLDDGESWARFSDVGYHAVSFAPDGSGWAVGADGRIARFVAIGHPRIEGSSVPHP